MCYHENVERNEIYSPLLSKSFQTVGLTEKIKCDPALSRRQYIINSAIEVYIAFVKSSTAIVSIQLRIDNTIGLGLQALVDFKWNDI
jgi:hypothetical protein